jgi:hypothetical protein
MMKRAYTIVLIIGVMTTILTSVHAQSDRLIAANVPFNFVIKDRALPAGEYIFALVQIGGSDAIKIQSLDGKITAFVHTRAAKTKRSEEPRLVFNRYENQYCLSQLHGVESATTQVLAMPSSEKRIADKTSVRANVSIVGHKK